MGKIKPRSAKEIIKILEAHGFVISRQKGSHIIMQKKSRDDTITVPIPNHKEIQIGTLRSIIRQSEINRKEFE